MKVKNKLFLKKLHLMSQLELIKVRTKAKLQKRTTRLLKTLLRQKRR